LWFFDLSFNGFEIMIVKNIMIFLLAFVGMTVLVYGCGERAATEEADSSTLSPGVDFSLTDGVNLVESSGGRKVWSLASREATYSMDSKVLKLKGVEAYFYKDRDPFYKIVGKDGQYDDNARVLYIEGGVVVTSLDGYTLRTDALQYSFQTKIATTESPVQIEGEGLTLSGTGMEAYVTAERVILKKDVKVTALPDALRGLQEGGK